VRHTDACRFVQSGADEQDRPVARQLAKETGDLIGRDPAGSLERELLVPVAPHVHEERAFGDKLPGLVGIDATGRAANGCRNAGATDPRRHANSLCRPNVPARKARLPVELNPRQAAAGAAHLKGERMNFGLRTLLLLLATILFVVAALNNDNFTDLVSVGLAVLAGAFLVEETGFGRSLGSRRVG
jgi:hypothetical protein